MEFHPQAVQQFAAGVQADQKRRTTKEERPVILVTTVDIGDGKSDKIEIRRGDDPEDAARAFCMRHNLPASITTPLTAHILDNLKKANKTPDSKDAGAAAAAAGTQRAAAQDAGAKLQQQQQHPYGGHMGGHGAMVMDAKSLELQLSAKLMTVSDAAARGGAHRSNLVDASEALSGHSGAAGGGPKLSHRQANSSMVPSPRGSVHHRLYTSAQDKHTRLELRKQMEEAEADEQLRKSRASMSWISAKLMQGRGANDMYDNYGEMLYAEGLELHHARAKKAEEERKARDESELEGATFAPSITKKAWELKLRESGDWSSAEEKWQRLHERGMRKSTVERLEHLRQQREEGEVAECTFHPKIDRKSDAMMSERAETLKVLNLSHHDQLFQDALRRQAKEKELAHWYPDGVTFQPQVNKDKRAQEYLRRSYDKAASSGSAPAPATSADGPAAPLVSPRGSEASSAAMSVVDRLYAQMARKQRRAEELKERYAGQVDPDTGKLLYQPETGRAPRNYERNKEGRPIGEYLYEVGQGLAAKRAAVEEEERRAAEEAANTSHTTQTSHKLFAQLKVKRVAQIFDYLDDQRSGAVDLVGLVGLLSAAGQQQQPAAAAAARNPRVDNLDNEVLLDVEAAAALWARAHGMDVAVPELPSGAASPRASVGSPRATAAAAAPAPQAAGAAPPALNLSEFMAVMEQAIALRPRPRAYLVPSPAPKQATAPSFRPHINEKSRQIAARLRPADAMAYEVLHQVAASKREKLEARRKASEDTALAHCTFAPQLNPKAGVEGRALNRAGSKAWAGPGGAGPGSGLATVLGSAEPSAPSAQDLGLGGAFDAAANGPEALAAAEREAAELEQFELLERELSEMKAATQLSLRKVSAPGNGSRRSTRDAAAPAQQSVSLMELAGALEGWDHSSDPQGLASVVAGAARR